MTNRSLAYPVKTENASIGTVSVTICTLCVDKKQMTLAVFKQIPIVKFIDHTGALESDITVWGKVNYDGHWWAIGSRDMDLVKARIDTERAWIDWGIARKELEKIEDQCDDFRIWAQWVGGDSCISDRSKNDSIATKHTGSMFCVDVTFFRDIAKWRHDGWYAEKCKMVDVAKRYIEVIDRLSKIENTALSFYQAQFGLYCDHPQLFIAV